LRVLKILNENETIIRSGRVKIKIVFNEFRQDKYARLAENIDSVANYALYEVKSHNEDFLNILNQYYDSMNHTANFLFLDQNGIKQITEDVFQKLIALKSTDFLFFISSSFIKRFAELEEFKRYLKITKQDLEGKSYYHIHRIVLNYYRSLIPGSKKYFLAPFSIKKPAGIYGLIFGSNHMYGIEKFLNVCWKHDKLTGEANFDIDNENIDLSRPSLYPEFNIPSKRQVFENNLRKEILSAGLKTNIEVYLFALNEGFLMRDANTVLQGLKSGKKINFNFKLITSKLHKELPSEIKLT
jgi:three-Cys-motif partner protein